MPVTLQEEHLGTLSSLASSITLPATYTINIWVKNANLDSSQQWANLYWQSGNNYLLDAHYGQIGAGNWTNNSTPDAARLSYAAADPLRVADTWHLVTLVYDGATMEYFANGVSMGTVDPNANATLATAIDTLNGPAPAFAAEVKDLRVYEGVATAGEILVSFNNGDGDLSLPSALLDLESATIDAQTGMLSGDPNWAVDFDELAPAGAYSIDNGAEQLVLTAANAQGDGQNYSFKASLPEVNPGGSIVLKLDSWVMGPNAGLGTNGVNATRIDDNMAVESIGFVLQEYEAESLDNADNQVFVTFSALRNVGPGYDWNDMVMDVVRTYDGLVGDPFVGTEDAAGDQLGVYNGATSPWGLGWWNKRVVSAHWNHSDANDRANLHTTLANMGSPYSGGSISGDTVHGAYNKLVQQFYGYYRLSAPDANTMEMHYSPDGTTWYLMFTETGFNIANRMGLHFYCRLSDSEVRFSEIIADPDSIIEDVQASIEQSNNNGANPQGENNNMGQITFTFSGLMYDGFGFEGSWRLMQGATVWDSGLLSDLGIAGGSPLVITADNVPTTNINGGVPIRLEVSDVMGNGLGDGMFQPLGVGNILTMVGSGAGGVSSSQTFTFTEANSRILEHTGYSADTSGFYVQWYSSGMDNSWGNTGDYSTGQLPQDGSVVTWHNAIVAANAPAGGGGGGEGPAGALPALAPVLRTQLDDGTMELLEDVGVIAPESIGTMSTEFLRSSGYSIIPKDDAADEPRRLVSLMNFKDIRNAQDSSFSARAIATEDRRDLIVTTALAQMSEFDAEYVELQGLLASSDASLYWKPAHSQDGADSVALQLATKAFAQAWPKGAACFIANGDGSDEEGDIFILIEDLAVTDLAEYTGRDAAGQAAAWAQIPDMMEKFFDLEDIQSAAQTALTSQTSQREIEYEVGSFDASNARVRAEDKHAQLEDVLDRLVAEGDFKPVLMAGNISEKFTVFKVEVGDLDVAAGGLDLATLTGNADAIQNISKIEVYVEGVRVPFSAVSLAGTVISGLADYQVEMNEASVVLRVSYDLSGYHVMEGV